MKNISMNNNGVTAIYVRHSVADRDNNSLSIESQKEDCIRYIGADTIYRLYCVTTDIREKMWIIALPFSK